jgi:hypothetical protein
MRLNGQSALASGACSKAAIGTVTCVAPGDTACSSRGAVCGFKADTACGAQPAKGACWVVPATCPTAIFAAKGAEVCNAGQPGPNSFCESECTAVKSQARYALSGACN